MLILKLQSLLIKELKHQTRQTKRVPSTLLPSQLKLEFLISMPYLELVTSSIETAQEESKFNLILLSHLLPLTVEPLFLPFLSTKSCVHQEN